MKVTYFFYTLCHTSLTVQQVHCLGLCLQDQYLGAYIVIDLTLYHSDPMV